MRDDKGRFAEGPGVATSTSYKPGQSGNPGGRPRLPGWFKEHGEDALKLLVDVALGRTPDDSVSPAQAAQMIADRIYGKAAQAVEVTSELTPAAAALLALAQKAAKPEGET